MEGSRALRRRLECASGTSFGRPCSAGHSQFTRLLRAEYFLWRRRMQTGCTRLAVKQWPGIGVAMECARDAPLPRPSAVLPCACDFTRCDPASLGASLYSPRHTDLCGQCDAGRTLRPGLGVTMELETLPFGGRRSFAVRMWCSKVLRPWELCSSHLATTLLDRARENDARAPIWRHTMPQCVQPFCLVSVFLRLSVEVLC